MRFAVDAHAIGRNLTGNEVYASNLLQGLAELEDADVIAYVASAQAQAALPQRIQSALVSGNPFLRLGYQLNAALRRDHASLLHVQYTGPVLSAVPLVVTVHDVSFLEHPEYFKWWRAAQLRLTVGRSVRQAACVLVPSEFSREALLRSYGLPEERVWVTPYAVSRQFRPLSREVARERVKQKFRITAPYVLSVGDLQPRKNHLGLIEAFAALVRDRPDLPHELVLVGQETWHTPHIRRAAQASGISRRIHFMGFVTDEDLLQLYGGCDITVFPSFYEGFGFPVLESMACGRAMACSNASSLPEVAGSAALLFSPHSCREMVRAMRDLLLDGELRARMERLSLQRAGTFDWKLTANRTLQAYQDVARKTQPSYAGSAARAMRH